MKKFINTYLIAFIIAFHSAFLFSIIYIFNNNIPWVDDWQWIENLQTNELSFFKWLFKLENIHNHMTVKLLLFFNKFYLDFNFQYFSYFSVMLLFFSSLLLYNKLYKEGFSNFYIGLLLIILFSSKQFPSITQMSNVSWFISLFFIILFFHQYNLNKIKIIKFICLFLSPLTLGFGAIIPLYLIIIICIKFKFTKIHVLYLFCSFFSLFLAFIMPRFFFFEIENFHLINISHILTLSYLLKFIYTYFGLLGSLALPWIEKLSVIAFVLGLFQFFILIFFLFKQYLRSKSNINFFENFFENNLLLVMGLFFPFLVAFTRAEWDTSIQPRYATGVIVYQIGFLIYFYRIFANEKFYIFFKKSLICYVAIIFFVGNFTPYLGLHWQVTRSYKSLNVINCFELNKTPINECIDLAYKILFYEGRWYDYEMFSKQIYLLKEKNHIFFKDINE